MRWAFLISPSSALAVDDEIARVNDERTFYTVKQILAQDVDENSDDVYLTRWEGWVCPDTWFDFSLRRRTPRQWRCDARRPSVAFTLCLVVSS